ncbi:hypothetical protein MMC15_000073 [Xylographa vitiligo]|nr:hypothetical protein [Xylographa vitiligo]
MDLSHQNRRHQSIGGMLSERGFRNTSHSPQMNPGERLVEAGMIIVHRTARRSREDRLMRSMLANPYGINRHMAHSNGEEDGVEGSSSVSATASSWMLLAADLEERAEENE